MESKYTLSTVHLAELSELLALDIPILPVWIRSLELMVELYPEHLNTSSTVYDIQTLMEDVGDEVLGVEGLLNRLHTKYELSPRPTATEEDTEW